MKNPVLSPSLMVIDKSDIYDLLENNPKHAYMKQKSAEKGKPFFPVLKAVKLRKTVKRMLDDQNMEGIGSTSLHSYKPNKEVESLQEKLNEKNKELKKMKNMNMSLQDDIKDLEESGVEQEERLDREMQKVSNLQHKMKDNENQMKFGGNNNEGKKSKKNYSEINCLKNQVNQLKGANNQYKEDIKMLKSKSHNNKGKKYFEKKEEEKEEEPKFELSSILNNLDSFGF